MILHYFQKKENTEKKNANELYKFILKEANSILRKNNIFNSNDFNSSFEIVSILLIIQINININNRVKSFYKINENLVSIFISDLDESLRVKGIGDMSIGKYVKKYVKKFYFRLSKFPKNINNNKLLINYLKLFDLIKVDQFEIASKIFIESYKNRLNQHNTKVEP
tara:strand:+ start:235 stop:732 length:498 start_codon:yes stop_codon:yes gene_type:complete